MQVATTLVPLLKFYFHEEVRKAAVSGISLAIFFPHSSFHVFVNLDLQLRVCLAVPELLRSAKLAVEKGQSQGRNESYIKQLTDYIVPALVEALHKVVRFDLI